MQLRQFSLDKLKFGHSLATWTSHAAWSHVACSHTVVFLTRYRLTPHLRVHHFFSHGISSCGISFLLALDHTCPLTEVAPTADSRSPRSVISSGFGHVFSSIIIKRGVGQLSAICSQREHFFSQLLLHFSRRISRNHSLAFLSSFSHLGQPILLLYHQLCIEISFHTRLPD